MGGHAMTLAELSRMPAIDVEQRVLAAVLAEPDKLALANDLEVGDFVDYRHRAAFEAMRNLQADGWDVEICAVADAIAIADLDRGRCVADHVSLVWLTKLVNAAPKYEDQFGIDAWRSVFDADLRELRLTAIARAEVM